MANFSLNLSAGAVDTGPDNISTGTSAPGAGDIELRVSNTNITNRQELIRLVQAFVRYFEDGRYDNLNIV